ncbi:MAG TPA: biotin/lipoyl-binding protein, partial [Candidatus Polarisedimenticolia bacterium]|nr:biotin/lipoyl-binding protein [Candidatus Polarisedimenticolia bacterium]
MNRNKLRRMGITSAVLLAIAALIVYGLLPSPILVETADVRRGSFQVTVDEEGQTRVRDRFVLSSPVPGRLIRVELEDGDPVQKGQVLAQIDPLPLSQREREEIYARVKAAEANLRQAKAREAHAHEDREQARRDRYRAERLSQNGVISSQALDQARNADVTAEKELEAAVYGVQVADSEVQVARAGLVGINEGSGKPRELIGLRSPVEGKVLR